METALKLKALGHPIRLQIIKLLLQKNMCVRSLAAYFSLSEPTVSVHLKILKNAGLITGERKGYYMHYRVNRDIISGLAQFLNLITENTMPESECGRKNTRCQCNSCNQHNN